MEEDFGFQGLPLFSPLIIIHEDIISIMIYKHEISYFKTFLEITGEKDSLLEFPTDPISRIIQYYDDRCCDGSLVII